MACLSVEPTSFSHSDLTRAGKASSSQMPSWLSSRMRLDMCFRSMPPSPLCLLKTLAHSACFLARSAIAAAAATPPLSSLPRTRSSSITRMNSLSLSSPSPSRSKNLTVSSSWSFVHVAWRSAAFFEMAALSSSSETLPFLSVSTSVKMSFAAASSLTALASAAAPESETLAAFGATATEPLDPFLPFVESAFVESADAPAPMLWLPGPPRRHS